MSSILPKSPSLSSHDSHSGDESSAESSLFRIKNISVEAFNFIKNENEFYDYIHSFSAESSPLLRITNSKMKRISSGVLLDDTVLEVKRPEDTNFERKHHTSILSWYKEVTVKSSILDALEFLDHIHIGENRIPLRTVLEVYKEKNDEMLEYVNIRELYKALSILLFMFIFYLVVLYFVIRFT